MLLLEALGLEGEELLSLFLHEALAVLVDVVVDVGQDGDDAGRHGRAEFVHVRRFVPAGGDWRGGSEGWECAGY